MFRCQNCNEITEPGEPQVRMPTVYRKKTYKPRRFFKGGEMFEDKGGTGYEIVSEIVLCPACAPQESEDIAQEIRF